MGVKEESEVVTQIKKRYFCDICGAETNSPKWCKLCGRLVCTLCRTSDFEYYGGGDYPAYICSPCWNIGEKYRSVYHGYVNRSYMIEGAIFEAWETACKKDAEMEKNEV